MKYVLPIMIAILSFAQISARNPFEPLKLTPPSKKIASLKDVPTQDLKLQAVLWDIDQNMAIFEAPDGQTFFAKLGTKIGKKDGKVTKIDDNIVIVSGRFGEVKFSISDP